MRRVIMWTMFGVTGALLGGCGTPERAAVTQQRQLDLNSFKPIVYIRRTDIVDQRITIAADGSVSRTRSAGGKLSEFQMMQLARMFQTWEQLKSQYPAPDNADATALTTIKYGDKSVTVSDNAKEVPEQFTLIRRKIEQYLLQVAQEQ